MKAVIVKTSMGNRTIKIEGTEGKRIGFHCDSCGVISNIKTQGKHFTFECGSQFCTGYCRECGSPAVVSIWEEDIIEEINVKEVTETTEFDKRIMLLMGRVSLQPARTPTAVRDRVNELLDGFNIAVGAAKIDLFEINPDPRVHYLKVPKEIFEKWFGKVPNQVEIISGYPFCSEHGAMNKVSKHGIWRCLICHVGYDDSTGKFLRDSTEGFRKK